jgi:DNA-binding phage protein
MQDWTAMIRNAIERDKRTLYRLSKDAGVTYQNLHRFVRGERTNIGLDTAAALANAVGLELRPKRERR